jgi:hypothetical protein
MATKVRFLTNAPTHNRPPDYILSPNADSARPQHRRHNNLVFTSCYQNRHHQNKLISIVPKSHELRTYTVKLNGYWLLYLSRAHFLIKMETSRLKYHTYLVRFVANGTILARATQKQLADR